jgi:hypothetical protein
MLPVDQAQAPLRRKWTWRRTFWFENGELQEIVTKLGTLRWGREPDKTSICELNVLSTLILGIPMAYFTTAWWGLSAWWGLMYLVAIKQALQCLNEKRFLDNLP